MFSQLVLFAWIVLSLLLLLTVTFSYLLTQKVKENRWRKEVESYKTLYEPILLRYLFDGQHVPAPLVSAQYVAMMELLDHFILVLDNGVKERATRLAEQYLSTYLQKQLHHRRLGRRMNALFYIEDFQLTSFLPELEKRYDAKETTMMEKRQLLKMFALFRHPHVYEYMKQTDDSFTQFDYRLILSRMDDETFAKIVDHFFDWNEKIQYAIMDMIGIMQKLEHIPFLRTLLQHKQSEYRIRALKALAEIAFPLDAEQLLPHLQSPIWQERLMALRLCARTVKEELIETIEQLMKDRVFSVRSQAAEALLRMPNGLAILERIAYTSDDPYARDMALEWLERGREYD
ncbi:HEAT repeat domain-containing protein [Anoxybacillus flavithermus]|uniref:HEAT repeat containing protein n=1 Tax=Anoxybacillus flavithermus (strain DSM 21510 / WK1) TaxID=491915 RepID=B7GIE2_ANOFW|nr:HEAT repeat domain-containing protein [Anoxybacillus flavithermus]ACJ34286.1 HEAT repeat containing protein [Anoxybacillus flavithermus WK1]